LLECLLVWLGFRAMPAFGEVNTPGDQLIWRQLIAKEQDFASRAPKSGFSLRGAVNREEVPVKHKPGHINPNESRVCKGFDPKAYGWDPKGELAKEFFRCRKRSVAPPTIRFLFPETTAQENGWCLDPSKGKPKPVKPPRRTASLPSLPENSQPKAAAGGSGKIVRVEGEPVQRRPRRREEGDESPPDAKQGESINSVTRGVGKWASDSQLSANRPNGSVLSALPPSMLSATAPSCVSSALPTEVSSCWPGVAKELVTRVREQDSRIETAMKEFRRYQCYGDRGNKHFVPLGETDATAYANAFMLATSGVPPHKWDPRASAAPAASD